MMFLDDFCVRLLYQKSEELLISSYMIFYQDDGSYRSYGVRSKYRIVEFNSLDATRVGRCDKCQASILMSHLEVLCKRNYGNWKPKKLCGTTGHL